MKGIHVICSCDSKSLPFLIWSSSHVYLLFTLQMQNIRKDNSISFGPFIKHRDIFFLTSSFLSASLIFSLSSHFVVMLKVRYASLRATGAPVAQLVKRWPTDLADRIRSSLEVKSSQP